MSESRPQISQVTAIYNSDEFLEVYKLVFDHRSTEDLQRALEILRVWNIRCPIDNPELKCTELLVQVLIRDRTATDNPAETQNLLRSGYSLALTKFLNTLCHDRYKNFRVAAASLGLESFVVDLRNVGNHSNNYASLELYRRVMAYCLEWLREGFWAKELDGMLNIEVSQIQRNDVEYEGFAIRLFLLYDALVEALEKHSLRSSRLLNTVDMAAEKVKTLCAYAVECRDESLNNLFQKVLTELRHIVLQSGAWFLHHLTNMFVATCEHFFVSRSVKHYQPLIRLLIHCNQLRALCERLLGICESGTEPTERKTGALFWLETILDSMNKFKHLKDIPLDDSLAEDTLRNAIKVYKQDLAVDMEHFLVIGDLRHRPWKLEFDQAYLSKRMDHLCEYTKPIIVRLLKLACPAFSASELNDVEKQLEEYFSNTERRLKRKSIVATAASPAKEGKFGVWSTCAGVDWRKHPMGAIITNVS